MDESSRPTALIRRYENIYSDERVELLDVLEQTGQGQSQGDLQRDQDSPEVGTDAYQLPEQLLVSVIVVSCIYLPFSAIMSTLLAKYFEQRQHLDCDNIKCLLFQTRGFPTSDKLTTPRERNKIFIN